MADGNRYDADGKRVTHIYVREKLGDGSVRLRRYPYNLVRYNVDRGVGDYDGLEPYGDEQPTTLPDGTLRAPEIVEEVRIYDGAVPWREVVG